MCREPIKMLGLQPTPMRPTKDGQPTPQLSTRFASPSGATSTIFQRYGKRIPDLLSQIAGSLKGVLLSRSYVPTLWQNIEPGRPHAIADSQWHRQHNPYLSPFPRSR
jgi:hypothetical protein